MPPLPRQTLSRYVAAAGLVCLPSVMLPAPAPAQIVPDGSLAGDANPRIGPDYLIPASVGRLQGGNMFHSFRQFRVGVGESATFTGPNDGPPIANVVARVTGGQPSEINGLLRVSIPGAGLIFVNPAGVSFGPEASLDVGGAVAFSTADVIEFADGARFNAAENVAPAVLSSASPAAFGFLDDAPASIAVTGRAGPASGLAAARGQSISLVGGGVSIVGGRVLAIGGRVNVISVGSAGQVNAAPAPGETSDAAMAIGDLSAFAQLGAVELLDGASIEGPAGGGILIRGGSLRLERSTLNADNDDAPGGGIDVDVRATLDVINSRIASDSFGTAPGGAIRLRADALTVRGFAPDNVVPPISTNAAFNGPGGDIVIDAGSISLSENAAVTSFVQEGAAGAGGDLRVTASREISVDGSASVALTGLAAEAFADSSGEAGDITVAAPVVRFTARGEMTSTTRGEGAAGTLRVDAGQLLIDGRNAVDPGTGVPVITGLQTRVGRIGGLGATGRGGRIIVNAALLRLVDGGVLSATTFGRGAGGDVEVDAQSVEVAGSDPNRFTGIFARTQLPVGGGAGGNLTLRARRVEVSGAAAISAESTGAGAGGTLDLTATRFVRVRDGGSVSVSAGFPDPRDLAPGDALGPAQPADAGELSIRAPRVELRGGGLIAARAARDSGVVRVAGGGFTRVSDAAITAEAGREGGRIDLASDAVVLERSVIRGRAAGEDVTVTISAAGLIQSRSVIETDNLFLPPDIDIAGSLSRLPGGLTDPDARLVEACGVRLGGDASSFIATGRGGSPLAPGGFSADLRLRSR